MRAVRFFLVPLLPLMALALPACDDPTGTPVPTIFEDTVFIAAPTEGRSEVPSALDILPTTGGGFVGERFPERLGDAEQWDLTVRRAGSRLVFAPPRSLGFTSPRLIRAGITQPYTDRTYEDFREAPPASAYVTTEAVPVLQGQVYAVRSRAAANGGCVFYGKIRPLEVDVPAGTVRLQVTASSRCNDPGLTED